MKVSEKPIIVNLSFDGAARKDKHYGIESELITIPANEKSGVLEIDIIDVPTTTVFIDISINSVDGAKIGEPSFQSIRLKSPEVATSGNLIKIKTENEKQKISGFGGAVLPEWVTSGTNQMSQKDLDLAFDVGEGKIGLSILRLRIPPNESSFSRSLNIAKTAHEKGVTVFASPWTPPASMKTNNNVVGGELKEESYADFAAYLKKYVDYYKDNGVPIYAVSIQNEPDYEVTYESCNYSPQQMTNFIKDHARNIGDVKIIAPESFQFRKPISNAILNDAEAVENIDIVGGHIYGGGLARYPLAQEKGKELWMTEHFINEEENRSKVSYWKECMMTAVEISDCMEVDMNAYIWWYTKRFYSFIEDKAEKVTKKGFVMSQFSRFVRPGFTRVEVENRNEIPLKITAYKNGNEVVIVVINDGNRKITFDLDVEGIDVDAFNSYVTTSALDCEKMLSFEKVDAILSLSVDANSVTTFVSK